MNIGFTPNSTGVLATLGDDPSKYTIVVEKIGGQSIVQNEPLAGGANPVIFPRGNVSGQFVFRSTKSYATCAATIAQFIIEYGRMNQQGTLVVTEGANLMVMAGAICRGVERIYGGDATGVRMAIRYTFEITTITSS